MMRQTIFAGLALTLVAGSSWAQQSTKVHRLAIIGMVAKTSEVKTYHASFFEELARLGYAEGKNLIVEVRSPEGEIERNAEIARELIQLRPDVIYAFSPNLFRRLNEVGSKIPIVALLVDPVGQGFAESLARPGRNLTGVAINPDVRIYEKYIELVRAFKPNITKIALLSAKDCWERPICPATHKAAEKFGISVVGPLLREPLDEAELRRVMSVFREQGAEAVVVPAEAFALVHLDVIIGVATSLRLPAVFANQAASRGGLVSYSVDENDNFRRAARYVAQILEGANPADMPIHQPTKFRLAINLNTAKALGLDVPAHLLGTADEVIE